MDLLIRYALQFVGLPYRWGGDDTIQGFDCSGLVQELLASVGMDPPGDQTAQALFDHFEGRSQWNTFKPGALIFFGKSVRQITHVGMLLDPYRMIEAGGGGSATVSLEAAARQNAYVRIRHIQNRKDRVAVLYPQYASIGLV